MYGTFETSVHRKKTDNSIYINWEAFATQQWKTGTLKGLFRRAFLVCSTNDALEKEIQYLKKVFIKTNGYPSKIVHKTLNEIRQKITEESNTEESEEQVEELEGTNEKTESNPYTCLPYRGTEGMKVLHDFKKKLQRELPNYLCQGNKTWVVLFSQGQS